MMGAYLSKPVTDKELESNEDDFLSYASGSMQGWRTSQEDAHNCILDFAENLSLFAVYDGHGGAEVAQLCAEKLPDHVRESKDFQSDNMADVLVNSFLSFDDEILSTETQEILKKLANIEEMKSENDDDEEEDDDAALLKQEALTPLSEILKKYQMELKSDSSGDEEEKEKPNGKKKKPALDINTEEGKSGKKKILEEVDSVEEEAEDEEEDDEDDEEFVLGDENVAENEDEEEEDEEEDEDEEEEEEDDDEDDEEGKNDENNSCFPPFQYLRSAPGFDSGSTAVLSIIDRKLMRVYVANVGDSRCVLCRNGEAIDLSIDHKPEDEIESERITRAGGMLSEDGRVNGGLNLSRSIGDHSYKKNKQIAMRDQMISALPDVQTIDLRPGEDEFLVLACDGIWNSFSSQQLVEFIKKRISVMSHTELISQIFSHCLAPNTSGDGTGCDNMTCVIVTFKFPTPTNAASICNGSKSANAKKRTAAADLENEETSNNQAKLLKTTPHSIGGGDESVKI